MMDEVKAKAICLAQDLTPYTRDECAAADRWVRDYALNQFRHYVKRSALSPALSEWTLHLATATYGSVETDTMLIKTLCYPQWLRESES